MNYLILVVVVLAIVAIASTLYAKSPAQLEEDLYKIREDYEKTTKEFSDKTLKTASASSKRDLGLDALITLGIEPVGDAIDKIKIHSDPLVKLCVVYMFLENLHSNASEESSGLSLLSYDLFKANLTEEEWKFNFYGEGPNTGHFEKPVFWACTLSHQIKAGLDECSNADIRSNVCASLCAELTTTIDDDQLLSQFSELARKYLILTELYTDEAEASIAALEL